ncbi:MAG: hypothetical protein MR966_05265 [Lachnospiraceae bacterium]|nr:hypothetical protein [Lachnospiraceae bacterium]MDD7390442.1 hypothetical protein [Lachnospiraceae bacterium]
MDRILTANQIGELAKNLYPKYQNLILTNITMLLFQQCCDEEKENAKNNAKESE